ncbi:Predicted arabinose efflux permease, MFS family [Mycolicibacterium rutilum]|uniref:Predicted arabinose efflux permease, MFS family n=1 Tax=Mycolicibacterium rutilum TaxID=370526 RepID=A0A1H6IYN3_MYCRU|nr:MFS transporter [Mycolicibacterium rutilum]SEH54592.1 Predicted arabinose efflux permease, MFS family [Mycolicibacterium rutilum]
MPTRLTVLFAIAGGVAVGNLYYSQPLLHLIGTDLHVDTAHAGLLVTGTQIGYALGVLLLVPLGDSHNRRALIPALMTLSAGALVASAVAPTLVSLAAASVMLGLTTVSGQLLTPLAGDLAEDRDRGRVVGIVVSGLITGILVSRIASGVIASAWGWRSVFVIAAVLTAILAAVLYVQIPSLNPKTRIRYPTLLKSVVTLLVSEPKLRVTAVLGATGFAAFTMFWTALTLLLSSEPYGFSAWQVGLFGIAGLVGALAAQGAGRLHDRGHNVAATGCCWVIAAVAWVATAFERDVLAVMICATIVFDIAIQGLNILNQSRVFALSAAARSRINTAYVTSNFVGGALGSLAAAILWNAGGWTAVAIAGAALCACGWAVWLTTRRGALAD